ncbi:DUF5071 domain-containing protein [Lysinibacillus sp. NPDC047702]|uniref:DUF5071 domain-containing protein n=1 Tax=unclassified Lysinibacillus TaxID=2636778 RepID=UPI003D016967
MERLEDLLPKNKHDSNRVTQLKYLERKKLIPLIPELLTWIQDINWPIAPDVAELLLIYPNEIVPHIKNVLSTNDDIWKYWCLEYLVKRMPLENRLRLKDDLVRMAKHPTVGEKLEEVDELAIEIIQMSLNENEFSPLK